MQKVMVFAGCKQSGKSTAAKYISALRMQQAGNLRNFRIDEAGDLLVSSSVRVGDDYQEAEGILDLYRQDFEFENYAFERIWPHAKIYSFATELKESAINIFSLDRAKVYGSNNDKGAFTNIKWANFWHLLDEGRKLEVTDKVMKQWGLKESYEVLDKYLTIRELLQEFGTLCRLIDPNCWVNSCWNKIKAEEFPYCIIDDCRFENEIDVSVQNGGDVVLFTRKPYEDSHVSEQIHKVKRNKFQAVIDNTNMSLDVKSEQLRLLLDKFGWNTTHLE